MIDWTQIKSSTLRTILQNIHSHKPLNPYLFFLLPSSLLSNSRLLFFQKNTANMPNSCPLESTINCTVGTCPLSCAQVEYLPTLAGNAVYAAAFGLLLIAQLGLGIKYKTWGFMVGMICGLVLELVGYAGRIMLHDNPFNFNNFIMYDLRPDQSKNRVLTTLIATSFP